MECSHPQADLIKFSSLDWLELIKQFVNRPFYYVYNVVLLDIVQWLQAAGHWFFHPLQLHWFYMKFKRRAHSHHKHWRRSEASYINYIVWRILQEMSPGMTVLILCLKQTMFHIHHERNSCKNKKFTIYKGIIVKIVICHASSPLYTSVKHWTTFLCNNCLERSRWERVAWNSSNCTTFLHRDCASG